MGDSPNFNRGKYPGGGAWLTGSVVGELESSGKTATLC